MDLLRCNDFFISWAVVWRTKITPNELKGQIKKDFQALDIGIVPCFLSGFDVKKKEIKCIIYPNPEQKYDRRIQDLN